MKKIQLSIPTPCHENWEAMKPEERGRFCGSCQKTVIDFTAMSDRQLAEFFRKPVGSACGRFHRDQLERPVEVPKKRIPWVKYFFQITWPAFVLLLKSCGQKSEAMGKPMAKEIVAKTTNDTAFATMGIILPDIIPLDSLPVANKAKVPLPVDARPVVGELKVSDAVMGDSTALRATDEIDTAAMESKALLDTVNITGYQNCRRSDVMGGLSITEIRVVKKEAVPFPETPKQPIEAVAYPNPVKAGGQLTVSLKAADDAPKRIQLFSSSGALVRLQQSDSFPGKNITLPLPSSLPAGTYFIRITSGEKDASTVKIIVLN